MENKLLIVDGFNTLQKRTYISYIELIKVSFWPIHVTKSSVVTERTLSDSKPLYLTMIYSVMRMADLVVTSNGQNWNSS